MKRLVGDCTAFRESNNPNIVTSRLELQTFFGMTSVFWRQDKSTGWPFSQSFSVIRKVLSKWAGQSFGDHFKFDISCFADHFLVVLRHRQGNRRTLYFSSFASQLNRIAKKITTHCWLLTVTYRVCYYGRKPISKVNGDANSRKVLS